MIGGSGSYICHTITFHNQIQSLAAGFLMAELTCSTINPSVHGLGIPVMIVMSVLSLFIDVT